MGQGVVRFWDVGELILVGGIWVGLGIVARE